MRFHHPCPLIERHNSILAHEQRQDFEVMREWEHVKGLKVVEMVVGGQRLNIPLKCDRVAAGVQQQAGFQSLNQCHAGDVETAARWVADDRVEVVRCEFSGRELIEAATKKLSVVTMVAANGLVGTCDGVARYVDAGARTCAQAVSENAPTPQ